MYAKFNSKGLLVKGSEEEKVGSQISYGAFALAAAEIAYVAKGIKDGGIIGGIKNTLKLTGAEACAWVPYLTLRALGNDDNLYVKAYDKVADVIGSKVVFEEE